MFFKQPRIRRYEITPFYYDKKQAEDDGPRIRFRRILRTPRPEKKPTRRYLILIIGIVLMIWYFSSLDKNSPIEVESIQIEDISGGGE